MLRTQFDAQYEELVATWSRHQDLRKRHVPIARLAESRRRLEFLRDITNATRHAFALDRRELESVLVTTYCHRLDEMVFLYTADAEWTRSGPRFICACGDPIDGEGDRVLV